MSRHFKARDAQLIEQRPLRMIKAPAYQARGICAPPMRNQWILSLADRTLTVYSTISELLR